ncbi:hypothetical protein NA78x_004743 [Anatilimnocola sp. NA78]|uniref:hypothetical protein n=1 Tax=Anatilimnocola sp. NA78 TaxID=3415683 RepID=UPI003CE5C3FA
MRIGLSQSPHCLLLRGLLLCSRWFPLIFGQNHPDWTRRQFADSHTLPKVGPVLVDFNFRSLDAQLLSSEVGLRQTAGQFLPIIQFHVK